MAFDSTDRDVVVEFGGAVVPVEQGVEREIPLNRLFLSEKNVRKLRNPETIPALAAMIEAQGLLYRLCVIVEKRKGSKGEAFGVVAGGRRLAALQWLVERGRMAKDAPVKCLEFDASRGVAVSLTENAHEQMHPADQVLAFRKMLEEGKTSGQIAAAFGVSVLTVERRLALANLAPMFMDLFRANNIKQEQLQALTLTSDHERQRMVWESLPSYDRSAYHIKKALTNEEVPVSAPLAVYVGIEAYRNAGGSVREDLFAEADSAYLQDATLLTSLAVQRLEAEAQALRETGWKWVEARLEFTSADRSRFSRLTATQGKASKSEKAAMTDLQASIASVRKRLEELDEVQYGEGDGWTEAQSAEYDSLQEQEESLSEQLEAMEDALCVWLPAQKASSGVVVAVSDDGSSFVTEGLMSAEDRKERIAAATSEGDGEADDIGAVSGPAPKARAEFSAALCENMTAHRSAAVAASLAQNPKAALVSLLHTLIVLDREPWQSSPLDIRFSDNMDSIERKAAEYDATKAAGVMTEVDTLLKRLPGDSAGLFAHLLAMELQDLVALLARYVARSYNVQSPDPVRAHRRGFDLAQGIESALAVNMADWWYPSTENYLGHVSKAKLMEAVTECVGAEAAQPIGKMKSGDAIAAAASLLDGRRWLPSTLRAYPVPVVEVDDKEDGAQGQAE